MIYLASASPRRQELLGQLGVVFETLPSNVLEVPGPNEAAREYVVRVARDKARFVAALVHSRGLPAHPVLGADTEVVLDGEILGKPRDHVAAGAMLQRLSARAHVVLTGIALVDGGATRVALSESEVTFASLTSAEIADYAASGEPLDKAGGYAIQGRAGAFIVRIVGSYSGIVGLPLYEVARLLQTRDAP